MSDEISVEGKEYVSSKRASQMSGYAQDYIGQLARKGMIDAQRVGGLWYVSMDSLHAYKEKSETFTPEPPKREDVPQDTLLSFDGRDFVSAARASEITGYHQDYVGQLARSGTILSKQVGNRWYVDREALRAHKTEKDALLAAVQSQSVGLTKPSEVSSASHEHSYAGAGPFLTYTKDDRDLMPFPETASPESEMHREDALESLGEVRRVPIHIVRRAERERVDPVANMSHRSSSRKYGKTIFYGTFATAALTIVIVLSFGFSSLKESSTYTLATIRSTASVGSVLDRADAIAGKLGAWLEHILVPELSYKRK